MSFRVRSARTNVNCGRRCRSWSGYVSGSQQGSGACEAVLAGLQTSSYGSWHQSRLHSSSQAQKITAGTFAKSSRRTLFVRRNTIKAVSGLARVPPNVVTPEALLDLEASLEAGGYRSAHVYFVELRFWAVEHDQQWSDHVPLNIRRLKRSLERGLGPPR